MGFNNISLLTRLTAGGYFKDEIQTDPGNRLKNKFLKNS
jgi:hypothetical protein